MKINPKQIESVLALPGPKRYSHFIKVAADQRKVWGLYADGWALAETADGQHAFPLWPARDYAELNAQDFWSGYEAREIDLNTLFEVLIPKLRESNKQKTMNTGDTIWLGVEGEKEGFPILMRIRRLTPQPGFGKLFVVTWSFIEDDSTQLPSPEFYSKLERFEETAIEEMEREHLGIFVASETGLGKTRYYLYTSSIESLASMLDKWIPANEPVEFASDDDQEWCEYFRLNQLTEE